MSPEEIREALAWEDHYAEAFDRSGLPMAMLETLLEAAKACTDLLEKGLELVGPFNITDERRYLVVPIEDDA